MQPEPRRRTERRGPDRPFHGGRRAADRAAAGKSVVDVPVSGVVAPVVAISRAITLPEVASPEVASPEVASPALPEETVGVTGLPLEVELATAGARARTAQIIIERPDPDFMRNLRAQLVDKVPVSQLMPAVAVEGAGRIGRATTDDTASLRRRLMPRIALRSNLRHTPSWAFAIAAGLIIGIVALAAGRSIFTPAVPPASRTVDAAGASLVRNGQSIDLGTGTAILNGDEIRTDATGHATVALGGSRARLDANSDLIVTSVTADSIALQQVAGRVYHRVWVPAGGTYVVTTSGITWTAHGTAFDLDEQPEQGGGTHLTLLTIENAVTVAAPGVSVTVPQGRQAGIVVGAGTDLANLSTGPQDASILADPWLIDNATRDVADGFDPGVLATVAGSDGSASPSPQPTASATPPATPAPTATPSASPSFEPSASPTPSPTDEPTPTATPTTTPKATPQPTDSPTVQDLDLQVKACPGGTILDWSAAAAAGPFDHYRTYRSASAAFGSPVLVSGSTTSSRTATSAADVNATGTRWYRTYAYDKNDTIIAKSGTRSAAGLGAAQSLSPFTVGQTIPGQTAFTWTAPVLPASCGSVTKLVYSTGGDPDYGTAGAKLLPYSGDVGSHEVTLGSVPSGTWSFRVQVIRITALGTVVTAETLPVRYKVP